MFLNKIRHLNKNILELRSLDKKAITYIVYVAVNDDPTRLSTRVLRHLFVRNHGTHTSILTVKLRNCWRLEQYTSEDSGRLRTQEIKEKTSCTEVRPLLRGGGGAARSCGARKNKGASQLRNFSTVAYQILGLTRHMQTQECLCSLSP
jgi:hypothetical protein